MPCQEVRFTAGIDAPSFASTGIRKQHSLPSPMLKACDRVAFASRAPSHCFHFFFCSIRKTVVPVAVVCILCGMIYHSHAIICGLASSASDIEAFTRMILIHRQEAGLSLEKKATCAFV